VNKNTIAHWPSTSDHVHDAVPLETALQAFSYVHHLAIPGVDLPEAREVGLAMGTEPLDPPAVALEKLVGDLAPLHPRPQLGQCLLDGRQVLMAKLATGLFAQGDQWYRGRTNNPWDIRRGSSGSSAGPSSAR